MGTAKNRFRGRKANEAESHGDGPALWLQLALEEVEMRTHVETGGPRDVLDRMLQMQARLNTGYPDMPIAVKAEFSARLNAKGYSEDAWNSAIAWLETTDWFRVRGRYLGNP